MKSFFGMQVFDLKITFTLISALTFCSASFANDQPKRTGDPGLVIQNIPLSCVTFSFQPLVKGEVSTSQVPSGPSINQRIAVERAKAESSVAKPELKFLFAHGPVKDLFPLLDKDIFNASTNPPLVLPVPRGLKIPSLTAQPMRGTNLATQLKPGLYQSFPYSMLVQVPEPLADDQMIIGQTPAGNLEMPTIKPKLEFRPKPPK